MRLMKRFAICTLLCLLTCLTTQAIEIPKEHIFVFERSTNDNYVCYDINLKDGSLCKDKPLNAYWVLGGGTRIEELTYLDRKMAFGVKVISEKENEAVVHLTAYKDQTIRICKHKGKWVGIVKRNGHEMILTKMYVQMKPPFSVKCEYIDMFGTDITTGEKHRERITP